MRNLIITSIALSVILGIFQWMFFGDVSAPASVTSTWGSDLDDGLARGRQLNRPVLALLTRPGSESDNRFEADVMRAAVAQMATAPFVAVRLDAAAYPELAERLHAPATPWIVIFKSGQAVDAFAPTTDADEFAAHLARAHSRN